MDDEKTLWAVSQGSYSDYSVVVIMASKELAEEYVALHEDWYTEEFPFLDAVPEHVPVLHLAITIGGPYHEAQPRERTSNEHADNRNPFCEHRVYFSNYTHSYSASLSVWGTDFERVRKVYTEQHAQALADIRVKVPSEK